METEQNRAAVQAIIDALSNRDIEMVLAHIHDEGSWSIPYHTDHFPYGVKTKAEFGERAGAFLSTFSKYEMRIHGIVADGDRVAVEASATGIGNNGVNYSNIYHISFAMKDGKAYKVLEFLDPFLALDYIRQINTVLP